MAKNGFSGDIGLELRLLDLGAIGGLTNQ